MCPLSRVTCHKLFFLFFYFLFFFGYSGEASQWGVCYQRDLPRLVFRATPGLLIHLLQLLFLTIDNRQYFKEIKVYRESKCIYFQA